MVATVQEMREQNKSAQFNSIQAIPKNSDGTVAGLHDIYM